MELNKEYKNRNGEIIIFDGIAMYSDRNNIPIDIYTSGKYHGSWNKKGRYLSNVYFLDGMPSKMDIVNWRKES